MKKKKGSKKYKILFKGSVTVYMLLSLLVLFSLFYALIEVAKINSMRSRIEVATELGLFSVLGEFNRELMEQYDVFFIDSSYGSADASYQNTKEHLKEYIEYNLKPQKKQFFLGAVDFYNLSVKDIKIQNISLAVDDNGNVFKRQAIAYMKNKIGLDFYEDIKEKMATVTEYHLDENNVDEELKQVEKEVKEVGIDEEQWNQATYENPATPIIKNRYKGILKQVLEKPDTISQTVINIDNYVSNRDCNVGTGMRDRTQTPEGILNESLFGEYIMEKCGNYRTLKQGSLLSYQIEYILFGKNSDQENLRLLATRLVEIRETANFLYLLTDTKKVETADGVALVISSLLTVPEIQPLVKYTILIAWSYGESVQDVKDLFVGEKVPVLKTEKTWKLSFDKLILFDKKMDKTESREGWNYEAYLRILLLLTNERDKAFRCMDIMEMDIRQTPGNGHFRMDSCFDSLKTELKIRSYFGYDFVITRDKGYK